MTMRGDRRHCHYLLICSVACAATAAAEDDVSYAALRYAIDRDRDRYDVYAAGYLWHDVRGLELLATLGACVIDRLHHDRASCTAAAAVPNKYL